MGLRCEIRSLIGRWSEVAPTQPIQAAAGCQEVAHPGLLRISLVLADERGLSSIDVSVVNTTAIVLHLEATRPAVVPPPKPRFDCDSRSRG
jgi:hypothetical protein